MLKSFKQFNLTFPKSRMVFYHKFLPMLFYNEYYKIFCYRTKIGDEGVTAISNSFNNLHNITSLKLNLNKFFNFQKLNNIIHNIKY